MNQPILWSMLAGVILIAVAARPKVGRPLYRRGVVALSRLEAAGGFGQPTDTRISLRRDVLSAMDRRLARR